MMKKPFFILAMLFAVQLSSVRAAASENYHSINLPSTNIQLEFQGYFSESQKQMLKGWVVEMAQSVTSIYGEFPLKRARVKLVRSYSWFEPVPWGEIQRWRSSRVVLHVNPSFSYEQIRSDWTAVHELSHLLLPYVGDSDSWFSEGLASYYQNIARAKSGLLTEQEAFQKLFHGFRRGEKNARNKPVQLSLASKKRGNTMRIYWSGAAYFLNVDINLRKLSNNQQSLDSVLRLYRDCCLPNHRVTSLGSVISKLDELSKTEVFSSEYKKIIDSKQFPDYRESFAYLGISNGWRGVKLNKQSAFIARRNSLLKAD